MKTCPERILVQHAVAQIVLISAANLRLRA